MIYLFAIALIVLSALKLFNGEFLIEISDQKRFNDDDRRNISLTADYSNDNSISKILKWYEDFHDQSPKYLPSDSDNHSQIYSCDNSSEISKLLYETYKHQKAANISEVLLVDLGAIIIAPRVDNGKPFSYIDTSMVDVDIPSSYATANNTAIMNAGNSSADYNQRSILTSTSENEDQLLDTASVLKNNADMNDDNTKYIDIDDVVDYHVNNPDIDNSQISQRIEVKDDEVISEIQLVEEVKIFEHRNHEETSEKKDDCKSNVSTDNNNNRNAYMNDEYCNIDVDDRNKEDPGPNPSTRPTLLRCDSSDDKTTTISNASVLSPSLDSRLKRLEDLVDIRRELVKDYNSRYHLDLWICYAYYYQLYLF
jgi:hypothetical protein